MFSTLSSQPPVTFCINHEPEPNCEHRKIEFSDRRGRICRFPKMSEKWGQTRITCR